MIRTNITARGLELDSKLSDYIEDKLGGLDKYLPRRDRETATLEVVVSNDPNGREDNQCVVDAILTVHGQLFQSSEGTMSHYASSDIVEAKLKAQLRTYKEKRTTEPRRERMLSRLIGRTSETDPATPSPEQL